MTNNDKALSINEVEDRLSELISNMSETEKRETLERLEKWQQSKLADNREHPRKNTSIYVVCSGSNHYFRDFIKNISAGGLFIETETPLFVNQELITTFFLPGVKDPIKIKGKVVRTDSKGIAVKFDEPIPDI